MPSAGQLIILIVVVVVAGATGAVVVNQMDEQANSACKDAYGSGWHAAETVYGAEKQTITNITVTCTNGNQTKTLNVTLDGVDYYA